jgi:hypothetical protein
MNNIKGLCTSLIGLMSDIISLNRNGKSAGEKAFQAQMSMSMFVVNIVSYYNVIMNDNDSQNVVLLRLEEPKGWQEFYMNASSCKTFDFSLKGQIIAYNTEQRLKFFELTWNDLLKYGGLIAEIIEASPKLMQITKGD